MVPSACERSSLHPDNRNIRASIRLYGGTLPLLLCNILSLLNIEASSSALPKVLVLSETAGWDHQTRTAADNAISSIGNESGFTVTTTDASDGFFTDSSLAAYATVCLINTTGSIFTAAEKEAFQRYIRSGGGYVGVHASTDCEYEWKWYGKLTSANFNGHPFNVAAGKIAVTDNNHPSTSFLTADTLERTDEWYFWGDNPDFRGNPLIDPAENDSITVLMDLIESSINGSSLNHCHPICWCHEFEGGQAWYCGFGHYPQTFDDPDIRKMLRGGILSTMKAEVTVAAGTGLRIQKQIVFPSPAPNLIFDLKGRLFHPVFQHVTTDIPVPFSTVSAKKSGHVSPGCYWIFHGGKPASENSRSIRLVNR